MTDSISEHREYEKRQHLDVLRDAIWAEAKRSGASLDYASLLTLEQVRAAGPDDISVRAQLAEMLKGGAAMRLYAAILLGELDGAAARRALEKLLDDNTAVLVPFGDIRMGSPAGELAARLLAGQPMCYYRPMPQTEPSRE